MARQASHSPLRLAPLAAGACILAVVAAVSAFMLQPAVASHDVDVDTIGIGDARNTASDAPASSADRMRAASADTESVSSSARRSITVNDPDPVIVISAYDATNASTVAAAMALGTTDPLPTAPHIMPDESDGWSLGNASAYSHADNDDGKGNFGTDVTASGVPLSSEGLTVAVPESQAHLLGHAVALRYGETIIVATVTDTGGFESYGRALDLAPGCWKAFGVTDVHDWGVRSVYYKFL
ncbi:hypothetical protein DMP07_06540 [Slackia faecicanis]|uniref:RlpA-like protein double-psi beta-barrel domain-containing protein n=1 Tax=Slackia faecicanis TaxID=255723 RepID=A0A3N0AEY1_9ACTN|nr:hypothetical protein [Slackia faecicanis]RNL19624.1 hypothetical protein DMP07_06540 [Slackia faecicanis]